MTEPVNAEGVVGRPLPHDALGQALRGAFDDRTALPDDMARLLRALDRRSHGDH